MLRFIKDFLISSRYFSGTIFLVLSYTGIFAQSLDTGVPTGWAAFPANGLETTTGGGGATVLTVTTYDQFKSAITSSSASVIIVSGTIRTTDGDGYAMKIASNKTIIGADENATIYGGIEMSGVSNVIVRNINIQGTWPNSGPDDALAIHNSHHIWIDHVNIWDATDGILDITNESEYITISWCKFWYTNAANSHRLACLIGSGGGDHPEDWDHLKVTYHHCWYDQLVDQRMPRVMYGQVHIYNDYYTSSGNSYCIGVGSYGSAHVENNYFKNVNNPHEFMYDVYCWITAAGNIYDNTSGKKDTGLGGSRDVSGQEFPVRPFDEPPYVYTLDEAKDIPVVVGSGAGPHDELGNIGLMPQPGQGTVNVDLSPTLQWTKGISSTSYNISFGTDEYPAEVANTTDLFYNPGPLSEGTVYYWKVDQVTADDTIEGKIWRFRTEGRIAGYPYVAISSPQDEFVFHAPAEIPIETETFDTVGNIISVEFFEGYNSLGVATEAPWTLTWENVSAGRYELYAKIKNDLGYKFTSDPVFINVINVIPTVEITSPYSGQEFSAPADITITADASDEDGTVTQVEFLIDTNSLTIDYDTPYEFTWNDVPEGRYFIRATVTDNDGRTYTSREVRVDVVDHTGISNLSEGDIAVYPIPVTHNLIISLNGKDSQGINLKIYDPMGRLLKSELLKNTLNSVGVEELPQGLLLLEFVSGDRTVLKKIIKE